MNRLRIQLASSLLVAALSLAASQAATPPEGMNAGRWVLAPYWMTSLAYDDNLFSRCDPDDPECPPGNEIVSDFVHTVNLGMKASMPIKNSLFEFGYEAEKRTYDEEYKSEFPRDLNQVARASLRLKGSSGDRLTISETYTSAIIAVIASYIEPETEPEPEPGGSTEAGDQFTGVPYDFNVAEIELARDNPHMQGYSIRVKRMDYSVRGEAAGSLYDYRGYECSFEYRHPMPANNWLVAYHDFRLFNHYRPEGYPGPDGVPGELFRREDSASYQIGVRGHIGGRHPFSIRAGLGRFRYLEFEAEETDFKGLAGQANVGFVLGSRTSLNVSIERRPLPSFYSTYYISNVLRLRVDSRWLQNSTASLGAIISRSEYGDKSIGSNNRLILEGQVSWMFHDLVGLRLTATHWRRTATISAVRSANEITAGITLGWQ
jgi:hypothetical protein